MTVTAKTLTRDRASETELGRPGSHFALLAADVRASRRSLDEATSGLIAALSDRELLGLLDGGLTRIRGIASMVANGYNNTPFEAGRIDRLGIPGIRFTDGPRGVVMGNATAFPAAIARAASRDVDLEHRIGDAIGQESRALGANYFAGSA